MSKVVTKPRLRSRLRDIAATIFLAICLVAVAYPAAATSSPPSAPNALIAFPGGDETAFLSWQPPADDGEGPILEYRIYRAAISEPAAAVGSTVTTSFLDATLPDTPESQTYEYRVAAVNANGEGPPSLPAIWMPLGTPTRGCVHVDPWSFPPGVAVDLQCVLHMLGIYVGIP